MRTIVENLLALQKLILQPTKPGPDQQTKINELRTKVPGPVLDHFDRMVSRGRNGVALVRHGMCGECHIRIPVGTLSSLVSPKDVYLCETCACYLLLPLEEMAAVVHSGKLRPVARNVRPKTPAPAPEVVTAP
jgi:predicted  nucleic acid-binding Zn-ribbon protein